jgi:hypothetical protein
MSALDIGGSHSWRMVFCTSLVDQRRRADKEGDSARLLFSGNFATKSWRKLDPLGSGQNRPHREKGEKGTEAKR